MLPVAVEMQVVVVGVVDVVGVEDAVVVADVAVVEVVEAVVAVVVEHTHTPNTMSIKQHNIYYLLIYKNTGERYFLICSKDFTWA